MTVSSTENRIAYDGNGVTTDFAFPYRFLADADLKVYVDDVLLTLTTDYTVTGEGEDAGGTVSIIVPPATGTDNVVILRAPAATQELDLVENDPLPAEDVEEAFDRQTMLNQRLSDRLDRALVISDSDTLTSLIVPALAERTNNLLGFDANGDLVAVVPADIDPVLVTPFIQTLLDDVDAAEARATLGAAASDSPTLTGTVTIEDALVIGNDTSGNVYGESFTHVITNGTNVASSAFVAATYSRIASIVTGFIRMTIDTTAAGAFNLELSIPVASNFAAVSDAIGNGVANVSNTTPDNGAISSSVGNDRLILSGYAHGTGNESWFINYQYKII